MDNNGTAAKMELQMRNVVADHERECPARQGIDDLAREFAVVADRVKRIGQSTDRIEVQQRKNALAWIVTLAGWLFAGGLLIVNLIVR